MKTKIYIEYRNCIIFRNTEAGYKLRYSARTTAGYVSADTLKGIKKLIDKASA